MGKNKSIYFSLVIVSVVLSVVLSVLVSFVLRNMISTEIDNIRKSDLRQDSDQMHVLFKTEQENFNKELLFIQNGIKWDGFDSEAEIYERISDLVSEFGLYSVNIAEKSGNVVFSAGKNSSLSMASEKKALSEALSGRTGSTVTLKNDEILFTAGGLFPALNDCVIVIQKELSSHEWIAELADIMKCSMTIFIEDTSVETSDLDSDGKPRVGGKMGSPFILDTVYKKRQVLEYIDRYKGNVSATVFSPIDSDDGNAMLYLGIDMKKLTETSSRITSLAIPIVIIALLLSFAIILFIIFYVIMKPLKTTSDAFERLNGNSGYSDLTVSIEVKKENEIGKMIVSVNKFIDSLRKLISDVNSAESNLESIGNALASNSQESASAISQIMSNILSVKKQITRQNETIQEVQNTLDHSSAGIDNLERHIENQSSKISESSSSIEKMVENIAEVSQSVEKLAGEYKQLIDITDAGKVRQNEMAEQINNMAEQSKHLADANAVISQIAAQTNLLAMNAAIEAAHAGESGKGFSVVADEIRKLAENSAHQSDSIKKELEAIGVVIEDVVKASELSVKEFENITEKVGSTEKLVQEIDSSMNTQHQSSQQVLVNLRDINESTSSVLETSKDMASGIENVAAAAGNLGMMAQVVEGSMDEMTTGVKEINASAQHLSEMAMTTHENIKVMNNVLSKFKIS